LVYRDKKVVGVFCAFFGAVFKGVQIIYSYKRNFVILTISDTSGLKYILIVLDSQVRCILYKIIRENIVSLAPVVTLGTEL
jgi:hypothetical protein